MKSYSKFALNSSLALVFALLSSVTAFAETTTPDLNDPDSVKAALEQFKGKKVELTLESGQQVSGTVANVGTTAVQLSELSGKEFYDAVIPLEKVSSVTFRAKEK